MRTTGYSEGDEENVSYSEGDGGVEGDKRRGERDLQPEKPAIGTEQPTTAKHLALLERPPRIHI